MNNSPIFIYQIDESHLKDLVKIAIRTFGETFASTNSAENMRNYYNRCFTVEQFGKEMKDPQCHFFFAEYNGVLAGYLKVNTGTAQTEIKEDTGFEIERIYVLNKFQGKGVGKMLMDYAIELGRKQGKKYLWLGVYEKNHRALKFYRKFGMTEFDEHLFMMGLQPQRDVLMRLQL